MTNEEFTKTTDAFRDLVHQEDDKTRLLWLQGAVWGLSVVVDNKLESLTTKEP